MDPKHLKAKEICFELEARGLAPQSNQGLRRAQLRGVLASENKESEAQMKSPNDFDVDAKGIQETLDDLWKHLIDADPAPGPNECRRAKSRLFHLTRRIALSVPNGDVQTGKKEEFLSKLPVLEGVLLEHTDGLLEFNPPLSSTVGGCGAACSTAQQFVPVYKWGVTFSGYDSMDSVMSFLEKVEDLCLSRHVSKQDLFASAGDLFSGAALLWYRNVRGEVHSWSELVECLKRDYLPFDYDYELSTEIRNRTQGVNENVISYIISVEALFKRLTIPCSERDIIQQLLRNLNPFFLKHLVLRNVSSLFELKDLCRQIQEVKLRAEKYSPPPQRRAGLLEPDLSCIPSSGMIGSSRINEVAAVAGAVCWNCGKEGHGHRSCSAAREIFCFGCGRKGIYRSNCPSCAKNVASGVASLQNTGATPKKAGPSTPNANSGGSDVPVSPKLQVTLSRR